MNLMATYQSFPAAPPAVIAGALRFGNNQVLVSETQPGATPGQFLVATSASTLGWTTISSTTYADGLNTSTPAQPIQTASTTPLAGQYLRAFLPTNAIWDWGEVYGVKIGTVALSSQTAACLDDNSTSIGNSSSAQGGCAFGKSAVVTTSGVAVGISAATTGGVSVGNSASGTSGIILGNTTTTTTGISIGNSITGNTNLIIGHSAAATVANGTVVGMSATTTSGVRVGYQGSSTTGVSVGTSATATTGATVGTSAVSTTGVSVGSSASSGAGISIGTSSSATTGVTVGTTATSTTGIAIGTSATSTAGIAIGVSATASGGANASLVVIGNSSSANDRDCVVLGGSSSITRTGGIGNIYESTLIGCNNTLLTTNLFGGGVRVTMIGSTNAISTTGNGSISDNIMVGNNNTLTTGANNADTNIVIGTSNTVTGGTRLCTIIGSGLTNANNSSILMGVNGAPLNYRHTSGANFDHMVITANGTGTTLTAGAIMGRIVTTTLTGPANLELPTGTSMDSSTAITGSLWVGMCIVWRLQHITNSGVITVIDAASGHTYEGGTLAASPASRVMYSIRTGVNTWTTYG